MWYHENIGNGNCPIVDTWWQTETGSIMISPLPGVTTTKPGSATFLLPGVGADVLDLDGNSCRPGAAATWKPDLPLALDAARHLRRPGALQGDLLEPLSRKYFVGDGCKRDDEGYYWLLGRVDDVMNGFLGHRISTTEIESALVSDLRVAEAAVVSPIRSTSGEAIFCFVIARSGIEQTPELGEELRAARRTPDRRSPA
ncbi:MAG: AMP-binding protein [Chloroflexia bacterium]